jgi:pSer/pThr/pTyr-binding forkhead associated (FHA) protein
MNNSPTIISDSDFGKRFSKIKKQDALMLIHKGKNVPIAEQITIGRDAHNTISIDDSMVSRDHALVQRIKEAFFIKDLDSTNGTYVNGNQIPKEKYFKLNRGDVVKIGRTEIIIQ